MKKFIALLLVGLLGACGGKDNSEPPAELTSIKEAIPLIVEWVVDTRAAPNHAGYRLRPLIVGDSAYTIDTSGLVRRTNLNNGRSIWRFKTGYEPITGLGGNDGNLMIVTSRDGDVVAYREVEGGLEQLWSTRIGSEVRARPVVDGNQVFVRSVDGRLRSLSVEDGSQQWQVSQRVPVLSLTGNSLPVVLGDMVIVGADDGKLVAYDRNSAKTLWETTITLPRGRTEVERLVDLDGHFVVRDSILYVVSFQGNLAAVQAFTGDIIWSRQFNGYQAIAIDENALYLSSTEGDIWSIDRRTSASFWKQDVLHARRITAPTLIGDKLVVADYEGYLHWFASDTGKLLGRARGTTERNYVRPQVWNNSVITLDRLGFLSSITEQL